MFLTIFYMISSYMKMWQLQSIRTKLLQHISSSSCVAFYKMSESAQEFVSACSPHCAEPEKAYISDVLFTKDAAYGCSLSPLQRVDLRSWRAPPPSPLRLALLPDVVPAFVNTSECDVLPGTSHQMTKELLDVLLECTFHDDDVENVNILPAIDENAQPWKIVAWKMTGSNLVLALRGDIAQLTFLVSTFLNYETPIVRIMTVKFDNSPKPLDTKECTALSLGNINGSPRHCSKYMNTLKTITDCSATDEPDIVPEEPPPIRNHVESEPSRFLDGSHSSLNVVQKDKPEEPKLTETRKSDLRLELNKSEKNHKPSSSKTLEKKNISRSTFLDRPISLKTKSDKGGASCPVLPTIKPPNVLVYSESAVTRENIAKTLRNVLDPDRYAIYCTGDERKLESVGSDGAALLVVGGALPARASAALLSAFLGGASVLSLCSDLLISVLPFYQTAEVRERELVSFTYDRWKSVRLLHNVFCYQASPARRQFSGGSSSHPSEYKGHGSHVLKVEVLAAEQTWHTPSLLKATDDQSGGMAVFSQVHLELDSREYLNDDAFPAEKARLGILRKILDNLGLATVSSPLTKIITTEPSYTPAYFMGTYERKQAAAKSVATGCLKLVLPKTVPPIATSTCIPLLLHACPENFSPLIYFQELSTAHLGRLVVYSEVLPSTQKLINEQTRAHGLVVIADRQTKGTGRGGTVWLSPIGCVMFSLQVIAQMNNVITSRPALMQHISALACVLAIRSMPGYEDFDLRIKWPNDIYFGRQTKLGGIVLNTTVNTADMVFNIGIGLNLNNKFPTRSINDIIKKQYSSLSQLDKEKVIAHILNHLEKLYESISTSEDFSQFYDLYYQYWLHTDQEVTVVEEGSPTKASVNCRILGIDDHGYLLASGPNGNMTLHPDGNSFDMMKGLIAPKLQS